MSVSESGKRPSGSTGAVVIALIIIVVVYVLSFGPLVWVMKRVGPPPPAVEKTVEIIYAPLFLLYEYTWLHDPLEWYVGLWI